MKAIMIGLSTLLCFIGIAQARAATSLSEAAIACVVFILASAAVQRLLASTGVAEKKYFDRDTSRSAHRERMKRTEIILYLATFVLLISAIVAVHRYSLDGIQGCLFALVLNTDTEYAKGYTDDAFRQVRPGQTKEEVIALVGDPLLRRSYKSGSGERWLYSRSPSSTHYLYREIQLIGGVVSEKRHHFYID